MIITNMPTLPDPLGDRLGPRLAFMPVPAGRDGFRCWIATSSVLLPSPLQSPAVAFGRLSQGGIREVLCVQATRPPS